MNSLAAQSISTWAEDRATLRSDPSAGPGMTSRYRGLFGWADMISAETLLEWLGPLQPFGMRFEPTRLVRTAAAG